MSTPTFSWKCGTCGDEFATKYEADACEARGVGKDRPVGLVFDICPLGDLHICLAVLVSEVAGHWRSFRCAATRDAADGRADDGGLPALWSRGWVGQFAGEAMFPAIADAPRTKRMVAALADVGVAAILYDGSNA